MLDSVIGTFLTQNVADQLSSKAYMTLAAMFPAKPLLLKTADHNLSQGSWAAAATSLDARLSATETSEVCAGTCHMLMHDLLRVSYHRAPMQQPQLVQGFLQRRLQKSVQVRVTC